MIHKLPPLGYALVCTLLLASTATAQKRKDEVRLLGSVEQFVTSTVDQIPQIPLDRRQQLEALSKQAAAILRDKGQLDLVFICTHNSRRSQMAQVWSQVAVAYYGVAGISTYSGGTEATACNVRTVRAFESAGLDVSRRKNGDNPVYRVRFAGGLQSLELYSKVYHEQPTVLQDYFAVIVCGDAEERCPLVQGTTHRNVLRYQDPKESDGTPQEEQTYMQRNQQVACEMFFVVSRIQQLLK